jgi:hypothetical protein
MVWKNCRDENEDHSNFYAIILLSVFLTDEFDSDLLSQLEV